MEFQALTNDCVLQLTWINLSQKSAQPISHREHWRTFSNSYMTCCCFSVRWIFFFHIRNISREPFYMCHRTLKCNAFSSSSLFIYPSKANSFLSQGHGNCYFLYLRTSLPWPCSRLAFSFYFKALLKCYLFLENFAASHIHGLHNPQPRHSLK